MTSWSHGASPGACLWPVPIRILFVIDEFINLTSPAADSASRVRVKRVGFVNELSQEITDAPEFQADRIQEAQITLWKVDSTRFDLVSPNTQMRPRPNTSKAAILSGR